MSAETENPGARVEAEVSVCFVLVGRAGLEPATYGLKEQSRELTSESLRTVACDRDTPNRGRSEGCLPVLSGDSSKGDDSLSAQTIASDLDATVARFADCLASARRTLLCI